MTNLETTFWIFLALAISSQNNPTDYAGISQIADGINHVIPSQKEMQNSISWLINQKLILKVAGKYSLTETGNKIYTETQNETKILLKMWKSVENKFNEQKSVA
jgi:predicted transcriptional regulator